jgi:hypothetical protein
MTNPTADGEVFAVPNVSGTMRYPVVNFSVIVSDPTGDAYMSYISLTNTINLSMYNLTTLGRDVLNYSYTSSAYGIGEYSLAWRVAENETSENFSVTGTRTFTISSVTTTSTLATTTTIGIEENMSQDSFFSLEQGLMFGLITMLWLALIAFGFTLRSARGNTLGIFFLAQMFIGIALGYNLLPFSFLTGVSVTFASILIFLSKAFE